MQSDYVASVDLDNLYEVCKCIMESVENYLNGFPAEAYNSFSKIMNGLESQQLRIYQKTAFYPFDSNVQNDPLKLYRVVLAEDGKRYSKERVFHTPYNLRSRVSTNRYSIAGYPSLYLGTSLELCCEEIDVYSYHDNALVSRFELNREFENVNINIKVIELGIKPQDFVDMSSVSNRVIPHQILNNNMMKSTYLMLYPLIAASSFIRKNKVDPFAAEYIVPQLLMQWMRQQMSDKNNLMGIRYFSCASDDASDMGFNYVFPTSGEKISSNCQYCSVLSKAFRLTNPVHLKNYEDFKKCELDLNENYSIDFLDCVSWNQECHIVDEKHNEGDSTIISESVKSSIDTDELLDFLAGKEKS